MRSSIVTSFNPLGENSVHCTPEEYQLRIVPM